ncbi:hypothetical protein [Bradyrhizobium sp. RDM4]|uniref:hypothetical protein n=1 Tax=Bradyrhizobium sp. RDM4 TaxID=3378765 RepID=UPI0038FCF654
MDEVVQLVQLLNEMGVENLSLDLMYGLPQQTLRSWYDSLISLLDMGIEKFNVFPLMFQIHRPRGALILVKPEIWPPVLGDEKT